MSQFMPDRSRRIILAILFALFVAGHQGTFARRVTATPDEDVLRMLVVEFYARYAREDVDGFMSLWSAESPDAAARKQAAEKFFAAHESIKVANPTVRKVAVDGDKAKVWIDLEMSAIEAKTGKPADGPGLIRRALEFVKKAGGQWKVWREISAAEDLATLLIAAKTDEERARLLDSEGALVRAELTSALNRLGTQQRSQGKLDDAMITYRLAQKIAGQIDDQSGLAYALANIGIIQRRRGDFEAALESQRRSLTIFEALDDKQGAARALNGLGLAYYGQGDYHLALETHQKSLALAESLGNKEAISISLNNLGLVHKELGNNAQALEFYQKSLALSEETNDKEGISSALGNIGNIHRTLGDYDQAIKFQQQSLKLKEERGDRSGVANSLNDLGNFYRLRGEYAKALDHLQRSWAMREALGDKGVSGGRTLNSIGHIYLEQGDYSKALEYYNQALALSEEQKNKDGIASALSYIGRIHSLRGNFSKALEHGERSLELARQTNSRASLLDAYLLIGDAHRGLQQFQQARQALQEAVVVSESLRLGFTTQEMRASYFARLRDAHQQLVDLLMQMHRQSPSEGHAAAALHIAERARARSLLEALGEARADIRAGVDPILVQREQRLQQQINARAERQTRLLSGRHSAEQATAIKREIDALAAAYGDVQAEIRRSSPRYAALTQPQPLTLKEMQRLLDQGTVLLQYALGETRSYLWVVTPDSLASFELPKRALIEEEARRVRDLLLDGKRWAMSETIKAEYDQAADALSRMLLPAALVAELGTKRLAVVADGALQYLPLGALPVPKNEGASISDETKNRAGAPPRLQPLIVDHEIVSLPSASTLFVLRRETANRPAAAKAVAVFADPVFDVEDERVTIAARSERRHVGRGTASVRDETPGGVKTQDAARPNALAPPPQSTLPSELARAARGAGILRDGQQGLTRLPFSRREAEMILASARAGAGLKVLNFEANQATATSAELSRYRFVHFATHGLLNSEYPELSGIVLSLVDERGQPADGFLSLNEIYNLNLPVEMVVLSACQTALGKEIKGEGLVGLVRGFMYAGAPRVVASLWKVDDRATAELMKHFYEGLLKKNLRPAEALRRAKIEMLKEERFSAPFYWAAFALQGEWR